MYENLYLKKLFWQCQITEHLPGFFCTVNAKYNEYSASFTSCYLNEELIKSKTLSPVKNRLSVFIRGGRSR